MQSSSSQGSSPSSATAARSPVLADNFKCGVCFEKYNKTDRAPKSLVCGHSFCATCICKTEKQKIPITCPHCRRSTCVDHKLLGRNLHLIEILENTGNLADDDGAECDCPSAENVDDTGGNVAMRSFVQDVDGELTDIYVAFAMPQLLEGSSRPHSVLSGMFRDRYQRLNDDFEVRKLALNNAVTGMNGLQERIRQLKDEMQQVGINVRRLPHEMRRNHAHRTVTDAMPTRSVHIPSAITPPGNLSMTERARIAQAYRQVSANMHMLATGSLRMQNDSDSSSGSFDSQHASMPPSAVRGNVEHIARANHMAITRRDGNATEVRCFVCDERFSLTPPATEVSEVFRHTHSARHQQLMRENDSMLAESGRGRTSPQPSGSRLRGILSRGRSMHPSNDLPSMQGSSWQSLRDSHQTQRSPWTPLGSSGAMANNGAARYGDEWGEQASVPRRATQRSHFAYPRLGDADEDLSLGGPNGEPNRAAESRMTGSLENRSGNGQPGDDAQWNVGPVTRGTSPTDHVASTGLGAFGLADLTAELSSMPVRSTVEDSENDNEQSLDDDDWGSGWAPPRRDSGSRVYFANSASDEARNEFGLDGLNVGLMRVEDVSNAENAETHSVQPTDTVTTPTGPIIDFSEDDSGDYRDYYSDVDSFVGEAGRVNDDAANAGVQPWADSNAASEQPEHGFFHPQVDSEDGWYTSPSFPVVVQSSDPNESNESLIEFLRSGEESDSRETSGEGSGQQGATRVQASNRRAEEHTAYALDSLNAEDLSTMPQRHGRGTRPEAVVEEIASLFENPPGERDRGRGSSMAANTAPNAANIDFGQLFGQSSGAQAHAHPLDSDAREDRTGQPSAIDDFDPFLLPRNGNGSSNAAANRQPSSAFAGTVPLSSLSRPRAGEDTPPSNQNSPNPLPMPPLQQNSNTSRSSSSAIPRNPAYHNEADYENPLQRPDQKRSAAHNSRPSRLSRIANTLVGQ